MASHLTVITTNKAGISIGKGLSVTAGVEGGTDIFAALLGTTGQSTGAKVSASGEMNLALSLGGLVDFAFGGQGKDPSRPEDPDALAAAIDATLPIEMVQVAKPKLTELVEGLADLRASLEAGEPLDADLLKRVDGLLGDVAKQFGLNLDALPEAEGLATFVRSILPQAAGELNLSPLPADAGMDLQLTAALAPMAETLLSGAVEVAATQDDAAEFPALIQSVGQKLASLLQALNTGGIPQEQLQELGLDPDAAAEAEVDLALKAALARLINVSPDAEAAVAAPVLAKPALKLTEPVLTGKAGEEATAAGEVDAADHAGMQGVEAPKSGDKLGTAGQANAKATIDLAANVSPEAQPEKSTDAAGADLKPDVKLDAKIEAKIAAPAGAPAAAEPLTDPAAATQSAQASLRAEAAVAARTILPGYQTSQQQLNLPQIAFELVRQVNDGNTRFQIRLDPAELGKIDVDMTIDGAGQVNARLTVEKSETLDLMQRDQRALERALQQAGLDSNKTSLEFSLKQNPGGGQGQGREQHPGPFNQGFAKSEDAPPPAPTVNLYRGSLSASGVNIIA